MFLKVVITALCLLLSPGTASAGWSGGVVRHRRVNEKGRNSVSVKILSTKLAPEIAWVQKQVLRIAWTNSNGRGSTAKLTLQPYWRVEEERKPHAETWRMERTHVLMMLVYASDSGTAEFSAPLFCRLTSSHCLPLTGNLRPYAFSNHGSFALQGKRLYVWDAIHEGADAPPSHRYELRTFVWSKGRYHLISRHSTHRTYQPFVAGAGPGADLNPQEDPLREFGMHWQWGMLNHTAP